MVRIKALIFDLDDTLHNVQFLMDIALRQGIEAMIKEGLTCDVNDGLDKIKDIIKNNPSSDKFAELAKTYGNEDEEIIEAGRNKYYDFDFDKMDIFSDTKEVLSKLKGDYRLVLLSQGKKPLQDRKIDYLEIRDYFDYILLPDVGKKEESFKEALEELSLDPNEILVVGDRIDAEIKIGNDLGMQTCRILRGKYKSLEPRFQNEEPDHVINTLRGLYGILGIKNDKLKIVTIGGGTGTSHVLEGMKKYTDNISAIVNVTDSGINTGVIRRDFDLLAPGDIRKCLIALSNSEKLMCDLINHRFTNGGLEGYSFGNIFIAALSQLTGSFENAVEEACKILKIKGQVLPSTFDNINIFAELEDGTILEEEDKIIDRHNDTVYNRSPIKRVYHEPIARANLRAIKAIEEADLIILSAGSLYTSLISNLLVTGIPEAISRSKAKKVYVCNIMSQVSQTYGYKASDHVKKVLEYLDGDLDFVVLNSKMPNEELLESYKAENAHLIENDVDEIENLGISVLIEDVLDDVKEKKILWDMKNLLRHDPDKISELLVGLV